MTESIGVASPYQLDAAIGAALVHLEHNRIEEARASILRAGKHLVALFPDVNMGTLEREPASTASGAQ